MFHLTIPLSAGIGALFQFSFDFSIYRQVFLIADGMLKAIHRRGRCQAKQFQNRRTLRAGKVAVAAADIVSGNASLLVGRPRQRNQHFLPGHEMGNLYGIAHSVDVRYGGFHPFVDSDTATNTKLKTDIFCQMRIRGNTDGQYPPVRLSPSLMVLTIF